MLTSDHMYDMNNRNISYGPLTRYAKLRVAHAPGMPERFFRRRLQMKPLISDPGMHHGTCAIHVVIHVRIANPRWGKNVPGIPGACAARNCTYLVGGPLKGSLPWCKLHVINCFGQRHFKQPVRRLAVISDDQDH